MIGTQLSHDITARVIANHDRLPVLMDEDGLYVQCDPKQMALLLARMNCSAYIYADAMFAMDRDYLSVTLPVYETWRDMFKGRRGRKPNIALYVIDNNGIIQEIIKP